MVFAGFIEHMENLQYFHKPGKIMEYEKDAKNPEKNHGKLFHNLFKILEFSLDLWFRLYTLVKVQSRKYSFL